MIWQWLPAHGGRTRAPQPAVACMIFISTVLGQALSEVGANTVNQSSPQWGLLLHRLQGEEEEVIQMWKTLQIKFFHWLKVI